MKTFNQYLEQVSKNKGLHAVDAHNDEELSDLMGHAETAFGKWDCAKSGGSQSPEEIKKYYDIYNKANEKFLSARARKNKK